MLKKSGGSLTEKHVDRCSKLSGAFGREIDRLFTDAGLGRLPAYDSPHKLPPAYRTDVQKFVSELKPLKVCEYVNSSRHHRGFENFQATVNITCPYMFGQKMKHLAKDLDQWRELGV